MSIFTLTVNDPSVDKRSTEVYLVNRCCQIAGEAVAAAGGQKLSGNVTLEGGAVAASWTYTPTATS